MTAANPANSATTMPVVIQLPSPCAFSMAGPTTFAMCVSIKWVCLLVRVESISLVNDACTADQRGNATAFPIALDDVLRVLAQQSQLVIWQGFDVSLQVDGLTGQFVKMFAFVHGCVACSCIASYPHQAAAEVHPSLA